METMETMCRFCEETALYACQHCAEDLAFGGFCFGLLICAFVVYPICSGLFNHVVYPVVDWLCSLIRGARAKSEYYQMKLAQEKAAQAPQEEKEAL